MLRPGLVSVSFRGLPCGEIVRLAVEAGLQGIEWGGDVHVPPGAPARAKEVAALTREAGLAVVAYGSYYKLGQNGAAFEAALIPVLETAVALGAPLVRIWAGTESSFTISEPERAALVKEACAAADLAASYGLVLAFECHRKTLTDLRPSSMRLMDETDRENLRMYWQPNESRDFAENLLTLKALNPFVENAHVFHWPSPGVREPLVRGAAEWAAYLRVLASEPRDRWCLLEFMPDDAPESLLREADTLLWLIAAAEQEVTPCGS